MKMSASINWNKVKTYAVSIIIPVALGALVGLIISGFMDYEALKKPVLAPPPLLFPIAWSILYVLMGVSYGILKDKKLTDTNVTAVYYAQLAVNLLWPIFFFVFKWRLFAFIWIVVLAVLVIIMAVRFYRKNNTAGLLQLPYAAWTLFASYLNLLIYILNG
jgi:tryptophan-rich sensory protein